MHLIWIKVGAHRSIVGQSHCEFVFVCLFNVSFHCQHLIQFHRLQKSIKMFIKRAVHAYANACGLAWDIFGPHDNKTWLWDGHPDFGSDRKHSYFEVGNVVLHIDGFANNGTNVIHQRCFYAHNPLEEGPPDAEELPDSCHASGFLLCQLF